MNDALRLWPRVQINRDPRPIFMAGDPVLRDRYLDGLRRAGLEGFLVTQWSSAR